MKRSFKSMAALVMAAILFSGCAGLEKMKKNAGLIRYKVTPEILETHGGKVDVAVYGTMPGKYFDKKATLVATPVINYRDGETALTPVILQGEKVNANNKVIPYLAGGNFNFKEQFIYQSPMRMSDLEIRIQARRKKQSIDFEPVSIAKGVLATPTLMAMTPKPILGIKREANTTGIYDPAIDPFQRIVPDQMVADIYYLINSANLRDEEIKSTDVQGYLQYTKDAHSNDHKNVKKVEVSAYASPDGTIDLNAELASKREKASTAFLEDAMKKADVNANLRTRYTPEDWDGFKMMLENSNIQDKDLILRVLNMHKDPEVREREIKNLAAAFTQIADEILPKLRRAKMLTSIEIIGKSDEEVLSVAESNPGALNQAELLYAASLTQDLSKKLKIYHSFSQIFPKDWRGPNNEGFVLAMQGNYDQAGPLFEKAEQLKADEPIIKNNLGTIALYKNNLPLAEEYFGTASGSGNEVNYNLALVNIKKGDYNKANQFFRDYADPNTALVKLLSGNYNGALIDLDKFEKPECYLKEYLKAIIGARTSNEKLLFESLQNAVKYNADMKATAKSDLEFVRYFERPEFKAMVQ